MNEPELEAFARLWRGEEDAEERRIFRVLAWRAGLKAKALRFADYGLALLLVAAALLAMFRDTTPATLLFGVLLGGAAVWSTWKRRTLHQSALLGGGNDRHALIEVARDRCRLELRQSDWGLLLFPLGMILAALTKFSAMSGGHIELFPALFAAAVGRGEAPALALLLLILGELYFLYRGRRLRRELAGLDRLREQYRREALLDAVETAADLT